MEGTGELMETATGVAIELGGFAAIAAFTTAIVKSYIGERTKARRPTDQPVTLGEMRDHCEVEHTKIGEEVRREIVHVRELV